MDDRMRALEQQVYLHRIVFLQQMAAQNAEIASQMAEFMRFQKRPGKQPNQNVNETAETSYSPGIEDLATNSFSTMKRDEDLNRRVTKVEDTLKEMKEIMMVLMEGGRILYNTNHQPPNVKVYKLTKQAIFPMQQPTGHYYLLSSEKMVVKAKEFAKVPTDLRFSIPLGQFFEISQIPGVSSSIAAVTEVFESDFTNPLWVNMFNSADTDYDISEGQPLAMLRTFRRIPTQLDETAKKPRLESLNEPVSAVMENNTTDQVARVIVTRVSEQAILPTRGSSGFILYSPKTMTIPAWSGDIKVPTDLTITVPKGVIFKMGPIPGISWHTENRILGKLYIACRGPEQLVLVTMCNDTNTGIEIKAGGPIGQLKIAGNVTPELVEG